MGVIVGVRFVYGAALSVGLGSTPAVTGRPLGIGISLRVADHGGEMARSSKGRQKLKIKSDDANQALLTPEPRLDPKIDVVFKLHWLILVVSLS